MFRKIVFTLMIAMLFSTFAVGPVFAGQGKVTVCHKPGTAEEKTLEIAGPAAAAHLGHGDYSGPCQAAPTATPTNTPLPTPTNTPMPTPTNTPPPQSAGCDALNVLQAEPQYDSAFYTYIASNLEFYPGEMLHVDATITIHDVVDNLNYLNVGVYSSAAGSLVNDYVEGLPGEQITASADYTVVAGDGADQLFIDLIAFDGFTLDAVNFSCTPS